MTETESSSGRAGRALPLERAFESIGMEFAGQKPGTTDYECIKGALIAGVIGFVERAQGSTKYIYLYSEPTIEMLAARRHSTDGLSIAALDACGLQCIEFIDDELASY